MNFVQAINALHNVIWGVFLTIIFLLFFGLRLRQQAFLAPLVDAVNRVSITVWMVLILAGGVLLTCCGQKEQGSNLIVGAFAVLRAPTKDEVHAAGVAESPKV
ncbi:MAG TPA: hypothetical protein VGQ12_07700 [Candidatus Angelobacter sp.]|jgi:hypothetical protein|nr:hypothetical protein [Candidatus Angelobacter sp.]